MLRQAAPPPAEAAGRRRWPESRLIRRLFPLIATVVLIIVGMADTTWYGPHMINVSAWALPDDLWGTLTAAQRLVHLNLGGVYTQPTALITFPGAAVILVPVVALIDAVGISLQLPGPENTQPAAWLLAGPYQIALSAVALFAADALAEHLGVSRPKRVFLAAAGAVVLWNVSVRWGHPEDAVAVGLLLYGILALARTGRTARSAWLIGAAVAVQPLVLLALPFVLVVIEPRRLAGFLARAAAPAVALLAAAAAANWSATVKAVTSQPNSPVVDHPDPVDVLRPASGPRPGGHRAGPGADRAHRRRMRAAGGAPVAGAAAVGRMEPGSSAGAAVVGGGGAGPAVGAGTGDGGVLPVAALGGGADTGRAALVAPDTGLARRRDDHVRLTGTVAGAVGLVVADGRGAWWSPCSSLASRSARGRPEQRGTHRRCPAPGPSATGVRPARRGTAEPVESAPAALGGPEVSPADSGGTRT